MINSKQDLRYYMECDRVSLRIGDSKKRPGLIGNFIWKYEIFLRKAEYHTNCSGRRSLRRMYYLFRYRRLGLKLGFSIPLNAVGPGLSLAHPGTVIINSKSKIGCNCRIQTGVTLGTTNGSVEAPVIGDNVFLGEGCKIIGNLSVADDVCIGANAVVVKSITEAGTTWGGVPAKKISDRSSASNIVRATEIVDRK